MTFCPECGQPVGERDRFCAGCGSQLDSGLQGREARKVVTALFADVVGSTALGERLDPEDFKAVVGGAVARMAVAVEAFGGEVIQLAGDGLLALFGAPVAHEDDPERATLAGLRIVEDIGSHSAGVTRELEIGNIAVRVGIETGLAVVGSVGGGAMVRYGATGDVLNTAARLQAESEPGMVLVGSDTQRLIAPLFEWGEPRQLALKGKAAPVVAYPVAAYRSRPRRRRSGIEADLVGRDSEIEIARDAVERVLSGVGGALIVSGEAGIGKTRLVAELGAAFEASDSTLGKPGWLEGRCVSYGEGLPYWPFRGLLRDWLTAAEGPATPIAVALRAQVERLVGERAAELVALLEPVLGLGDAESDASTAPPELLLQGQIQDAMATLLAAMAARGPLAIALDDVQWADASSLALVERLLGTTRDSAVLLILASRPEPGHAVLAIEDRALRELAGRAVRLRLEALPERFGRGLLGSLAGEGTLPADLERRLLARADGNPLYLEELVRSLVDAGALTADAEGWSFDREVRVEIPETVEKVILARIDRLSEPAHELICEAAVLGRQFPVGLLEAIAKTGESVGGPLRELEVADLLRKVPESPTPSRAFKHTLIQEAAYRSLLKTRRQALHLAAAEAIEELYESRIGEFWGMLAHHTSAAGDDRRAIEYGRLAGDAAHRLYAIDEAIEHYRGVLDAAERLELESHERPVCEAALRLGILRFERGDPGGGREELEHALEGARGAGDTEMQVEALLALVNVWRRLDFGRVSDLLDEAVGLSEAVAGTARVSALARLSIQYTAQLRLDRALDAGERALKLAEADGHERAVAIATDALKLVAQQIGDLHELEELAARLERICAQAPEDDYLLQWMRTWALVESAFVPLAAGDWNPAVARIDEALALARRRGRRVDEPLYLDALCWTQRSRGDYTGAIATGIEAADAARAVDHSEWEAWTGATLSWALLDARAPEAALGHLEKGLRAAEQSAATSPLTRCVALLAWARSMIGEHEEALRLAERAEDLLHRVSVPAGRAWLFGAHAYVAVARALIATDNPERAESLLVPIRDAAETARWLEVVACSSLVIGQARVARGDAAGGEDALRRALVVAEGGDLPAPAWEANASLARLLGAAGREEEAAASAARAQSILERLAVPLTDQRLRDGLLAQARFPR